MPCVLLSGFSTPPKIPPIGTLGTPAELEPPGGRDGENVGRRGHGTLRTRIAPAILSVFSAFCFFHFYLFFIFSFLFLVSIRYSESMANDKNTSWIAASVLRDVFSFRFYVMAVCPLFQASMPACTPSGTRVADTSFSSTPQRHALEYDLHFGGATCMLYLFLSTTTTAGVVACRDGVCRTIKLPVSSSIHSIVFVL